MRFRHYLLCATCVAATIATAARAQTYTISTLLGNNTSGYAGDGGALSGAVITGVDGIIATSAGIYISDTGNQRVRLISGGAINVYAGSGTQGYSGDGAVATSADFRMPSGLAVDSSGNLYIADTSNHVIRKVSGGNISTIAGNNGTGAGYSGDGGAPTTAQLSNPTGMAFDSSGNLYIADTGNNVVRVVLAGTTPIITTAVGTVANTLLSGPIGVAVDASGALYVADTGNHRIVKYQYGKATTVAGTGVPGYSGDGGPAAQAQLFYPKGIVLDAAGNIYFADSTNSRIRKITTDGTITTIAGNGKFGYTGDGGPATSAALGFPNSLTIDSSGNIYIADTNNYVIRQLTPAYPAISDGGVTNGASFLPQVSPGALASVFGSNFALANISAKCPASGACVFPTTLGGVSVAVNGRAAAIAFAGPNQVNFQVPWETTGATANVTVTVAGGGSNTVTVPLKTAAPGIFTDTAGHAIAANSDFKTLNSPMNPAAGGSFVVAYLTGSGPVSNQPASGAVTPGGSGALISAVTSSASATIGGTNANVSLVLAPGFFGVVQANVTIPAGLAPGDYPLKITINGETSNAATISVK